MKLVRTLSMLVALAGASTASAQAPGQPPGKPPGQAPGKPPAEQKAPAQGELDKAEVAKVEKFFLELHGAVVKHQGTCPKMAVAIHAVFDRHHASLEKLVESGKDLPQASKDKLQPKQRELSTALKKCRDDKDVRAAIQRFLSLVVAQKAEAAPPAPAKK